MLLHDFNVAGQPIVESPSEAIATFLRTDIDYLRRRPLIRRRDVPGMPTRTRRPVDESLPAGLAGAESTCR